MFCFNLYFPNYYIFLITCLPFVFPLLQIVYLFSLYFLPIRFHFLSPIDFSYSLNTLDVNLLLNAFSKSLLCHFFWFDFLKDAVLQDFKF